jgi:hypothetical protein
MKIDFDAFRRRGVEAYNRLCVELNGRIHGDFTIGYSIDHGDNLTTGDIKSEMDALRDCLCTLICLEDKTEGIEPIDIEVSSFAPEND